MLTPEEIRAAAGAKFISHNGRTPWGVVGLGFGPEGRVAKLRGERFRLIEGSYVATSATNIAWRAVDDVAEALGYPDRRTYENACCQEPEEVRRRLDHLAETVNTP